MFRWFPVAAATIFLLFMGIMALVTTLAYSRQSGSTGLDMAKIQQMRYEAAYHKKTIEQDSQP